MSKSCFSDVLPLKATNLPLGFHLELFSGLRSAGLL